MNSIKILYAFKIRLEALLLNTKCVHDKELARKVFRTLKWVNRQTDVVLRQSQQQFASKTKTLS